MNYEYYYNVIYYIFLYKIFEISFLINLYRWMNTFLMKQFFVIGKVRIRIIHDNDAEKANQFNGYIVNSHNDEKVEINKKIIYRSWKTKGKKWKYYSCNTK